MCCVAQNFRSWLREHAWWNSYHFTGASYIPFPIGRKREENIYTIPKRSKAVYLLADVVNAAKITVGQSSVARKGTNRRWRRIKKGKVGLRR